MNDDKGLDTAAQQPHIVNVQQVTASTVNINALVSLYMALRDAKAKVKAACDERINKLDLEMNNIENQLLKAMDDVGLESMRTEAGTVYKTTTTYTNVADWNTVLQYIRQHGYWHLLNKAVNKKAVEDILEETKELPPGVNMRREVGVNIRRS